MESLRPRRLTEFLGVLWKRRKLFFLMALMMLTATLIAIHRIPNLYESSALVVVNLRNDSQGFDDPARFTTLHQELLSRATLTTLIRKYDLYPKAKNMEEAIESLQKALKVETKLRSYTPQSPESVQISHRYNEPKTAQAVVADLVKIFEQGNEQIKVEAVAEAERLTRQIVEVEDRLRQIGPRRDFDLFRFEALARSRGDSTSALNQRQAVASSIETLTDKEYTLQRQIAEQRNLIAEQEKAVKAAPVTPGSAAYGTLLAERSRVEAEIKNYADQYTDKHPKMIQLRNQLSEINRQISRMETQTGPSLPMALTPEGRDLLAMQRELRRMEAELDLTQRQLQRRNLEISAMPAGAASMAGMAGVAPASSEKPPGGSSNDYAARTEYDRLVIRYNWLLEKQDSMLKLSGAQGPSHMMFFAVDPPNLPKLPVAPNRLILHLIALAVSIIFGLFIALASEAPRMFMINDHRDIEYYLGAPVLALIPETLTPFERARRRKLRMTRGLVILTLAAALTPILVVLFSYLRIFQIIGNK